MSLASEFQQKLNQQAQQLRSQAQAQPGQKEHPEDTVIVRNILVGDETHVDDVIPYANPKNTGNNPNAGTSFGFSEIEHGRFDHAWNTRDYFEVRWDGRPHRIKPGETKRFPRYLADHFAKHLIDFILTQREKNEKVTGLLKNRNERQRLYKQIIIGVDNYYNGDLYEFEREGVKVEQQVQQLNTSNAFDIGPMENPAIGYGTTDEAPQKLEPVETVTTDRIVPASADAPVADKPKSVQDLIATKTIGELRREASQLGIPVKNTMTKEDLGKEILAF